MAQVRLVQIGTAQPGSAIQIGKTGALLAAQIAQPLQGVPAAANIQLGKFNNQTGTFYRDPTGAALATGPIQVGTHLSNRTLGYITGIGTTATTTIATQTLPGAGYFSIWNAGNVQQSAISIQVPNCTGSQAKQAGSQQPLNQQAPSYYAGKQQPLNQQAPSYYAGKQQPLVQQPPNYTPGNYVPGFIYINIVSPGAYYPPNYTPAVNQPLNQQAPNYYAGVQQPLNQQAPSYYAGVQQPLIPATSQPASGALYNGSLVNPGQIASQGFALTIPNIGTLTTQGGVLQGTGAGGNYQAPGTYTKTASAAVSTQQGIVNFQATTHN